MHELENKIVLDKAHKGEDFQELQREADVDAAPGKLLPEYVEEFYRVAGDMDTALDDKVAEPKFSDHLTPIQRQAMEALYMATTAKHIETGEFISGIKRSDLLNQALIYLQPILALGLRMDFKEARPRYDQMVGKVTQVKSEISSAIRSQIMKRPKKKKLAKKGEQDPGGPRDAAADADEGTADENAEQAEQAEQAGTGVATAEAATARTETDGEGTP